MGQLTTNKQLAVDIIKSTVTLRQYQQFSQPMSPVICTSDLVLFLTACVSKD